MCRRPLAALPPSLRLELAVPLICATGRDSKPTACTCRQEAKGQGSDGDAVAHSGGDGVVGNEDGRELVEMKQ